MMYIYDLTTEQAGMTIKRYGAKYTLDNRSNMGEQKFYTYYSSGREKIILVARFADQYRQAENILNKFIKSSRTLKSCITKIKTYVAKDLVIDEIPDDESNTGVMQMIICRFKDIKIQFNFKNGSLEIDSEFEIIENNIFGNGIVVTMNVNTED